MLMVVSISETIECCELLQSGAPLALLHTEAVRVAMSCSPKMCTEVRLDIIFTAKKKNNNKEIRL